MKSSLLLLVLLAVAAPAGAEQVYSWTDANGVKHFSDAPPPANVTNAQKLNVRGGVTSSAPPADAAAAATDPNAASGPAMAAAAGYSSADIARNCEIAKTNLKTLEDYKAAGAKLASRQQIQGQPPPVPTAEEKQRDQQIDKARQQVKLFCTE